MAKAISVNKWLVAGAAGAIAWLCIHRKKGKVAGIGLAGDRTFRCYPDPHDPMSRRLRIYAYEPYFDKDVWVGVIDYDKRVIYPTHGYFYPHKYGKLMKKIAETEGLRFANY